MLQAHFIKPVLSRNTKAANHTVTNLVTGHESTCAAEVSEDQIHISLSQLLLCYTFLNVFQTATSATFAGEQNAALGGVV